MGTIIKRVDIHLEASGPAVDRQGPLIVFIHGAGGDSSVWEFQVQGLRDRRPVLCMDLPGHGRSGGEGESSIEGYAEWVEAAVRGFTGSSGYVLAGHSMGGAVALHLAARGLEGLAGVVLVGTGAKLKVTPLIFKALRDDPESFFRTIDRVAFGEGTPERVKSRVVESIRRCPPGVIYNDFAACDRFDMRDRIGGISTPALIICGDQDRLTPVAYSEYLHRGIGRSSLVKVRGAGHMVAVERPEEVNRALDSFLEGLEGRPEP